MAYEGYYYISTDPDNPWGSFEQRYVETKRTDYSDYINAAEGAGEFTAIKPVGKSAVDIDVRMGANQVSFTAPGLKSYRLFDAEGRMPLGHRSRWRHSQHLVAAQGSVSLADCNGKRREVRQDCKVIMGKPPLADSVSG